MDDQVQNAGDDQPDVNVEANVNTDTGEGQQQDDGTVDYMGRKMTAKELAEELKNTNAYVTRIQQQQKAPDSKTPEPDTQADDGSQEYSEFGLTKEQVKALRTVTGADKLQEELAAMKKEREERQRQEQDASWKQQLKGIEEKYKDSGVPLPTDSFSEQEKLLQFMNQQKIFNPEVAFREMHAGRLTPGQRSEAATSDRSTSEAPSQENAYRDALKKAAVNMEKIAQVEAQFKGDPTQAPS